MTLKLVSDATGGRFIDQDGTVVLQIASGGIVTFPQGIVKQSKAKLNFFSAYLAANFGVLTANNWTLVRLYTEIIDSANTFEPTTNGRYQPNIAGWYQISAGVTISGDVNSTALASIWKNGSSCRRLGQSGINATNLVTSAFSGSFPIYLNGTTDYVDLRVYTSQTNANALGDANGEYTSFSGYLIEAD